MSANVDKAQQIRPPIAMYALECTAETRVFYLPGDPMGITGTPTPPLEQGSHTMLTNFISIQSSSGAYVKFFGTAEEPVTPQTSLDPFFIDPTTSNTAPGPNPEPDPASGLYIPAGETVRFDMSELFVHGAGNARIPIQYISYRDDPSVGSGVLRIWRSSGR